MTASASALAWFFCEYVAPKHYEACLARHHVDAMLLAVFAVVALLIAGVVVALLDREPGA